MPQSLTKQILVQKINDVMYPSGERLNHDVMAMPLVNDLQNVLF